MQQNIAFLVLVSVIVGTLYLFTKGPLTVDLLQAEAVAAGDDLSEPKPPQWPDHLQPQATDKFLWFRSNDGGGVDSGCPGLMHQISSLTCAASEAVYLGRTLVLPSKFCVNGLHNHGVTVVEAIESIFDLHRLGACSRIVLDSDPGLQHLMELNSSSIVHSIGFELPTEVLVNHTADIIIRESWPLDEAGVPVFWFEACWRQDKGNLPLGGTLPGLFTNQPYSECIAPHPTRVTAARDIAKLLGNYVSLHVRRGDKISGEPAGFLANVTHPEALHHCLTKHVPYLSKIFLATNEESKSFHSKLRTSFHNMYTWHDFSDVLERYGIVHKRYDGPCLQDASACTYEVPNNYHLFQVELYLFHHSNEHVEVHDMHGTSWWKECAAACAPFNCTEASGSQSTASVRHLRAIVGM